MLLLCSQAAVPASMDLFSDIGAAFSGECDHCPILESGFACVKLHDRSSRANLTDRRPRKWDFISHQSHTARACRMAAAHQSPAKAWRRAGPLCTPVSAGAGRAACQGTKGDCIHVRGCLQPLPGQQR